MRLFKVIREFLAHGQKFKEGDTIIVPNLNQFSDDEKQHLKETIHDKEHYHHIVTSKESSGDNSGAILNTILFSEMLSTGSNYQPDISNSSSDFGSSTDTSSSS